MAQKKNAKAKKDYEDVSDFHADFMTESGTSVTLYLYEKEKGDRLKFVIGEAFIIYANAVTVKAKKKNESDYAFISWPSFYSKKKEQYYNQAFCFDKELLEEMNSTLTDYYFG